MKHRHTKALSILLTVCMIVGMLPWATLPARADASVLANGNCGTTGHESDVTWQLTDDGVLTVSGTGAMKDYSGVTPEIRGVPWYSNADSITSVVIGDGVTSIGYAAFWGCENIASVTIGGNVASIGGSAFRGCRSLTSVTIPNSVTTIETYAFRNCAELATVSIGSGVTTMDTTEPDNCFLDCPALARFIVDAGNTAFSAEDGVLFDKEKTTLLLCPQAKSGAYAVPGSVTAINGNAFSECNNLTEITIPASVTTVNGNNGDIAFMDCDSLTKVYLHISRYDSLRNHIELIGSSSKLARYTTVTFNAGDGSGTMSADKATQNGTGSSYTLPYTLPANGFTAPIGKVFAGWSVQIGSAAAETKAPGESINATADTTVTAQWLTAATAPTAASGLTYNGSEQTGVAAGTGYTLSGTYAATNAGSYTATATLESGYIWSNGTTAAKTISWSIAPKVVSSPDITLSQDAYVYDNTAKTPTVTVKDGGTAIPDSEYTVSYSNNTNAALSSAANAPTVTITDKTSGNYTVSGSKKFTINKATPSYTEPTGVTAKYGQTLANVALPSGWAWDAPATSVGNVGSHDFAATYTPGDTNNYNTVNSVSVSVTVGKADVTGSPTFTAINASGKTLGDAHLDKGTLTPDGTIAWNDGEATVVTQGTAYGWTYTPNDTTNYKVKTGTITLWARPASSNSGGSSSSGRDDYTPSTPTTTAANADGSTTRTTTNADGSKTAVTTAKDGSTATAKTDKNGNVVSIDAALSAKAVSDAKASGTPVTLPVTVTSTSDRAHAAEIKIDAPTSVNASNPMTVEIPVANVTASTVVLLVDANGKERIVTTSTTSETGVRVSVSGDVTVKVVDNAKAFSDVRGNEWHANVIAWATSHEVMNGMGDGTFAPDAETTQGMMEQILFNIDGNELVTPAEGEAWWNAADGWAASGGVTDGIASHDPAAPATREVDILMMFNYAVAQGYDTSARANLDAFSDASSVSAEAREAMAWAVAVGIINGSTDENGNVILDAQGVATRAQVSAMAERFCENVAQ